MTASGIQVRPIKISDVVRIRSMRVDLLTPEQSYGYFGERFADPWSMIPLSRRDRRSFVAIAGGQIVGLVDLQADSVNHRWILSRILTSPQEGTSSAGRDRIWQELVLQTIRAAGASRAKRIHAVLQEDAEVIAPLLETGFSEYAQDNVLIAPSLSKTSPAGIVRKQEPSDVWAIHQLYHSITPRPVQYAEALTSNFWGNSSPGQPSSRGFVVEDGFEIVAHCRVSAGVDSAIMHVMVHPDAIHLLAPVVCDVARATRAARRRPISVVVPDYLQEYNGRLESIGFRYARRQSRLVKYTVVARRVQFQGVEELVREGRERAVTGSPTMYTLPSPFDSRRPGNQSDIQEQNGFS